MITRRQIEVLHWMAEGKNANDIAAILRVKPRTVYFHLYRAMENLDCSTSIQAVAAIIRMESRNEIERLKKELRKTQRFFRHYQKGANYVVYRLAFDCLLD